MILVAAIVGLRLNIHFIGKEVVPYRIIERGRLFVGKDRCYAVELRLDDLTVGPGVYACGPHPLS